VLTGVESLGTVAVHEWLQTQHPTIRSQHN